MSPDDSKGLREGVQDAVERVKDALKRADKTGYWAALSTNDLRSLLSSYEAVKAERDGLRSSRSTEHSPSGRLEAQSSAGLWAAARVGGRITISPADPDVGNAVLSPEEWDEGCYWTLIGNGPEDQQNALAEVIARALNAASQNDRRETPGPDDIPGMTQSEQANAHD